jgi:hypothetical protein
VEGGERIVHDFAISLNNVIASASEAIHGAANAASEECIASSHPPSPEGGLRRTRVLLAITARHGFAISPHVFLREDGLDKEGKINAWGAR